jgi:hypothetical protein
MEVAPRLLGARGTSFHTWTPPGGQHPLFSPELVNIERRLVGNFGWPFWVFSVPKRALN